MSEQERAFDMIDSFVHEVSRYLPQEERQEIAGDLRASIYEEVEALAEAEAGGPTVEDAAGVLRGFGHPLKVAGQYVPQRYLIGPELYPAFFTTLRVHLSFGIVVQVLAGMGLAISQGWQVSVWQLFWISVELLLWIAGAVTAVFVMLQYGGDHLRWYEKWDPLKYPDTVGVIDRSDVITNLLSEGFFLLWWNGAIS